MSTEPLIKPLAVLVAEDVDEVRAVAVELLERAGHRPSQAHTGHEALHVLETARFDVILMDVVMPDMDGIEATRRIRAEEDPEERTPILAFTAGGPSARPELCLEAGMDAFLRKPVNPPVLVETVERFGYGKGDEEVPTPEAPSDSLLKLAGGDEDLLEEMARVFLEFAPLQLREMRVAQATDDPAALAATARDLRKSARVFRADGILIPAERVEFLGGRGIVEGTEPLVEVIAREVEVLEAALQRVRDSIGGRS